MNTRSSSRQKPVTKKHFIIKVPARGGSMMPLVKAKSKLVIGLGPKQNYRKGDVVIFLENGKLAAHRIIKKTKDSLLVLKGDNSPKIDGFFEATELFGRVEKIIYPGYVVDLGSRKNQFLKHFFVLYSRLNLRFPFLLNLRKLYKAPLLKKLYRFLLKS